MCSTEKTVESAKEKCAEGTSVSCDELDKDGTCTATEAKCDVAGEAASNNSHL